MSSIEQELAEVEQLVATVRPQEAEERLRSLIATMGDEELRVWEPDLRLTISRFFPKRRKALTAVLGERLQLDFSDGGSSAPLTLAVTDEELDELAKNFADDLRFLSERHIYQWSTYYRDYLSSYFDRFLDLAVREESENVRHVAANGLAEHTEEIWRKGYTHSVNHLGETPDRSITKSISGLQRFLDLPIEFFVSRDAAGDPHTERALRFVTSSMLRGILFGFAKAEWGAFSGSQLLSEYPRSWSHSLLFLTADDLDSVAALIAPSELLDGIRRSIRPLVGALDEIAASETDYVPLTALAQMNWETRRLDAAIQPPPYAAEPHLIEMQCYLDPAFVDPTALREASRRGVGVVIAPLRSDVRTVVEGDDHLGRSVVNAVELTEDIGVYQSRLSATTRRVVSALEFVVYTRRSPRMGSQPLRYNFAREFPLQNPFLTRYVHVVRSSVRELLRTFERRNGVRLWCSVRRSGKTTACLDLSTTAGDSTIITQTCETTGQSPDANLFYDAVCDAIQSGRQLRSSFLVELIAQANPDPSGGDERVVFVLDEYETLFGRLKAAVARDEELRYTVAQPLLNQMVGFTRENLLVFLGQQPNAHFILMDQNQLSAYVEQDPFPLFQHQPGAPEGELFELVRKVLTDRVSLDPSFVDALAREAGGHPYLTVNLLVEFVEWLIEKNRTVSSLQLDSDDFDKFAKVGLAPDNVSVSPEYRFFREAVSEALSSRARALTPWLHAVYTCLSGIARRDRETLKCPRGEFMDIVERAQLPEIGLDANLLLTTAQQANFLDFDEDYVWPRILLLARLSGVTRGKIEA